jgi:hypothetical protein
MNNEIVQLTLAVVCILTVFNLWLSFRLVKKIRYIQLSNNTGIKGLSEGDIVPKVEAKLLFEQTVEVHSDAEDLSKVYVFLSSACTKCKSKLGELECLHSIALPAGFQLRLLTIESEKAIKHFLQSSSLKEATWSVSESLYSELNPTMASPYYLFVDDDSVLKAQGMIGDENWQSFVVQTETMRSEIGV